MSYEYAMGTESSFLRLGDRDMEILNDAALARARAQAQAQALTQARSQLAPVSLISGMSALQADALRNQQAFQAQLQAMSIPELEAAAAAARAQADAFFARQAPFIAANPGVSVEAYRGPSPTPYLNEISRRQALIPVTTPPAPTDVIQVPVAPQASTAAATTNVGLVALGLAGGGVAGYYISQKMGQSEAAGALIGALALGWISMMVPTSVRLSTTTP